MNATQDATVGAAEKVKSNNQKGFKTVKVTLTSKGPGILMNPMTEDILDELAGVKSKAASDKDLPLKDRAERKVIRDNTVEGGPIGIPLPYLLAALIYAGRFVKNGKDKISTATTTTIYEFLTIENEFFPFTNQNEEMLIDKRRGVLNNAGKTVAVAIIRPRYKNWEITVTIIIDTNVMNEEVVKKVFEAAGRKAGIGDFRPAKKGPFGMFSVTGWEVLNG